MPLPILPVLAVCSLGMVATVVKLVDHHIKNTIQQATNKPIQHTTSATSNGASTLSVTNFIKVQSNWQDLDYTGEIRANVVINGEEVSFVTDPSHTYAHYDLAIDFCTRNGE